MVCDLKMSRQIYSSFVLTNTAGQFHGVSLEGGFVCTNVEKQSWTVVAGFAVLSLRYGTSTSQKESQWLCSSHHLWQCRTYGLGYLFLVSTNSARDVLKSLKSTQCFRSKLSGLLVKYTCHSWKMSIKTLFCDGLMGTYRWFADTSTANMFPSAW